jgi:hypothetical protein
VQSEKVPPREWDIFLGRNSCIKFPDVPYKDPGQRLSENPFFFPHNDPIALPLRDIVFMVVLFPTSRRAGEVVLREGRIGQIMRQPGE